MLFNTLNSLQSGGSSASCDTVQANTSRLADRLTAQALKSSNPKAALKRLADRAEGKLAQNNPDNPQEAAECVQSARKIARSKIALAMAKRAEEERKRKAAKAEAERQAKLAEKKRQEEARQAALAAEKKAADAARKKEQAHLRAAARRRAEAEKKRTDQKKQQAEAEKKKREAVLRKKRRIAAKAKAKAKAKLKAEAETVKMATAKGQKKIVAAATDRPGVKAINQQKSVPQTNLELTQLRKSHEKLKQENLELRASLTNLKQESTTSAAKLERARAAAAEGFQKIAQLEAGGKKLLIDAEARQKIELRQKTENRRLSNELAELRRKLASQSTGSAGATKSATDAARKILTLETANRELTKKLATKNTGPSPFAKLKTTIETEKSLRKASEQKTANLEGRFQRLKEKYAEATKSWDAERKKLGPSSQKTASKTPGQDKRVTATTTKTQAAIRVGGMPVRDDAGLQKFCRIKNTDRGRINQGMYQFCLSEENQGYAQMAKLFQKNAGKHPWLKNLITFAMTKWEDEGVTSYNMANFTVKEQFDAFVELERKKKKSGFNTAQYERCLKKWVNDRSIEYLMVGYCYDQ